MQIKISHPTTTINPYKALQILQDNDIDADVSSCMSTVNGEIHYTLIIEFPGVPVECFVFFFELQEVYGVNTAWIDDGDGYIGGIDSHPLWGVETINTLTRTDIEDYYSFKDVDSDSEGLHPALVAEEEWSRQMAEDAAVAAAVSIRRRRDNTPRTLAASAGLVPPGDKV